MCGSVTRDANLLVPELPSGPVKESGHVIHDSFMNQYSVVADPAVDPHLPRPTEYHKSRPGLVFRDPPHPRTSGP